MRGWWTTWCLVAGAWAVGGCQSSVVFPSTLRPRAAAQLVDAVGAGPVSAVETEAEQEGEPVLRPLGEAAGQEVDVAAVIREQLRDPREQKAVVRKRLEQATTPADRRMYEEYLRLLESIERDRKVELTLADVIYRTLAHNYAIQVAGFLPAIEAARLVQAEAAFDAVFFFNFTNDKRDTPTASQLQATQTELRRFSTGFRKLLSTGATGTVTYNWNRTDTNLAFATLNPSFTQDVQFQIRQPFLRNFGIDATRAQILLRRVDRDIGFQQLRRAIRDALVDAETAYWQLLFARRVVTFQAELLAVTQQLYDNYLARGGFDVYPAQLAQVRAQLESRRADFVRAVSAVKDAEDELKRRMNDPDLNFSEDIEIIPVTEPAYAPIVLDRVEQIQAALDYRSELREARLRVESARVAVGLAKNQALPRFDVTFTYAVQGLGESSDDAFDQVTQNNFHNYVVGVEFEWPLGNRGPRAAWREQRLRYAQAVTAVRQTIEEIIVDVNTSLRRIFTDYEQIPSRALAVVSSDEFLAAIQAREESKSPTQLDLELNAQARLAADRQNLLQALVDYNLAITNLERAKGTLLRYNNILLEEPPERDPY